MKDARRSEFLRVYPSVVLPMFLALVDQTIVATALPDIAAATGQITAVSWVVLAYLISATVAAPCYGTLADGLGKRRMMTVALGISMTGSLVCATAGELNQLIAGRLVQGLGGGGLMALSHAIIADVVPPRERARFQGFFSGVGLLASTAGPVLGGVITARLGWEFVFLVTLPLGLAAILLLRRLPVAPRASDGGLFRLDLVGMLLLAGAVVPFLIGMDRIGTAQLNGATFGILATAVLSVAILIRVERRQSRPVIATSLVAHPVIWRCYLMAACHGAALISFLTFLPLQLRLARGLDTATAGLLLLPVTVGIGMGSMSTGFLIGRTSRTAIYPACGLASASACLIFMAVSGNDLSIPALAVALCLAATGLGTSMAVVLISSQVAAGPERIGAAAGQVQLFRSLGAAFGTALASAALSVALRQSGPDTADLLSGLYRDGHGALPAEKPETSAAFTAIFMTIAAFPAIGAVLASSLPLRRID